MLGSRSGSSDVGIEQLIEVFHGVKDRVLGLYLLGTQSPQEKWKIHLQNRLVYLEWYIPDTPVAGLAFFHVDPARFQPSQRDAETLLTQRLSGRTLSSLGFGPSQPAFRTEPTCIRWFGSRVANANALCSGMCFSPGWPKQSIRIFGPPVGAGPHNMSCHIDVHIVMVTSIDEAFGLLEKREVIAISRLEAIKHTPPWKSRSLLSQGGPAP